MTKEQDKFEQGLKIKIAKTIGWQWDGKSIYAPNGGRWARYHPADGRDLLNDVIPDYPVDIAAAMIVFDWLSEHGVVRLSNGDGDSFDCDFFPTGMNNLSSGHGFVDMFEWQGTRKEAFVVCLAAVDAVS